MRISTNQMSTAGLRQLLARQAELQFTQLQLATNRRVLKPSDDPVAATTISALSVEISRLEQFNRNGEAATSSNELEETILASATDILFRIRGLMVQSVNGTLGRPQLDAIKSEMQERLEEILGLANTQNAGGDYLFSGSKVKTQAFTRDSTGAVIYNGDQSQRQLRVSSGVTVATSDSGFDVFVDVKNGNGKFVTSADNANTGSGIISPGSYQAPPNFLPEAYSVTFGTDVNGNSTYAITGDTSGATIVPATLYDENADITFASSVVGFVSGAVTTAVTGTPVAGDVFHISPSSGQNVFATIQNTINALDSFADSAATRAKMISEINAMQASLDLNMQNIDGVRGKLGSRLNAIDAESSSNFSLLITSKTSLSVVQELDVVEASTRLSQQVTVLEAAQASFVRVQGLNLFNFLR